MGLEGVSKTSNNAGEVSLGLLPQRLESLEDSALLGLGGHQLLELLHTSGEDVSQLGANESGHLGESTLTLLLELIYKPPKVLQVQTNDDTCKILYNKFRLHLMELSKTN